MLKPVFLTLLLLATSTSVLAAERYSEVWNPPEAQTVKGKAKSKNIVSAQAKKKRRNVTSVKKVADGSAATQAATAPRVKPSPKQSDPLMNLPRKIGPDGQVMRVNFSGG